MSESTKQPETIVVDSHAKQAPVLINDGDVKPQAPPPLPPFSIPTPATFSELPSYALTYAPLCWLNGKEEYWPGSPYDLLKHCHPQDANGVNIPFPQSDAGQASILELSNVDQDNVYLTLDIDDPRKNQPIPYLISEAGKPDAKTRRSTAPIWIILVDKSKIVGPGVVDVFYFYFYPYNLGNKVIGITFGNHVGDWEHSMVRFQDGLPTGVFYSAHADGHAWAWSTMEKLENRPVCYVASGSHANYGKNGSHAYSVASFLGPIDFTAKGVLWDPALNYCAASYDPEQRTFQPLSAAPGTSLNADLTPEQVVACLNFKGYWGNSFAAVKAAAQSPNLFKTIWQKLEALRWTQGPQGPRWKSLERKGVDWSTEKLLPKLV